MAWSDKQTRWGEVIGSWDIGLSFLGCLTGFTFKHLVGDRQELGYMRLELRVCASDINWELSL